MTVLLKSDNIIYFSKLRPSLAQNSESVSWPLLSILNAVLLSLQLPYTV